MLLWIYARPLEQIVLAIIAGILLWTGFAYFFVRYGKLQNMWKYGNLCLLLVSIGIILYMTVFSRTDGETEVILIPFRSFYEAKVQPELYRSMLMNVFLFVPFGMTMPYALMNTGKRLKYKVLCTILAGGLLSCMIEVLQFVFRIGRAEVDDVLCNILGAAVGSLSYCLYKRLRK